MKELINQLDTLTTKEDFIAFLGLLINEFKNNPDQWQNKSIDSYLEAMASWTEDMDGYYHNIGQSLPKNVDWKVFANILMAAKMYE